MTNMYDRLPSKIKERNKLGGGHYDAVDRKKWQKSILEVSDSLFISGQNAINYGMKQLIEGVLYALEGRDQSG